MSAETAWSSLEQRECTVGATRWTAEWAVWKPGHAGGRSCEDHFLEDCSKIRARSFPTRGLAIAFARSHNEERWLYYPRVCKEVFGCDSSCYGWWEREGDYEEVDR